MTHPFTVEGERPLPGTPGVPDGLLAFGLPRTDGTLRQRPSGPLFTRVLLRAAEPTEPSRPGGLLTDAQWRWATGGPRRRATVAGRLGARADEVAVALCRAGCVALVHDYAMGRVAPRFLEWRPHPALVESARTRVAGRTQARESARSDAEELAGALAATWPGVAAALRTPTSDRRLTWIVRAASDLAGGMSHDGPRAFVQHHVMQTKKQEDVARLLLDAGFEPAALVELGIDRSPYIGVGGPIRARLDGRVLDFAGWPGPVDLRVPAHRRVALQLSRPVDELVVVENRQAAEAIGDRHPGTAFVWCHGQPPDAVLELTAHLAGSVRRVLVCPDADLGGVRIAGRIHDALPDAVDRVVVDAGGTGHVAGRAFGADALAGLGGFARRADGVGALARACVRRGYAVEQEASVRAALAAALGDAGAT